MLAFCSVSFLCTSAFSIAFLYIWIAWRFRLPAILLLLGLGFLAGPITGVLDPDLVFGASFRPLVSLSVGIILFEGGLTLRFDELRGSGKVVRNLVTIGALVTWVLTSLAAHYLVGVDVRVAILVGAILVLTGPTVVIPLASSSTRSAPCWRCSCSTRSRGTRRLGATS